MEKIPKGEQVLLFLSLSLPLPPLPSRNTAAVSGLSSPSPAASLSPNPAPTAACGARMGEVVLAPKLSGQPLLPPQPAAQGSEACDSLSTQQPS